MKVLVFLLALANFLVFAYAEGYFGRPDNPDAVRMHKQIQPEGIKIASRGAPPSDKAENGKNGEKPAEAAKPAEPAKPAPPAEEPPKPPVATVTAEACILWSGLQSRDADRLSALLAEKFDDFKQSRRAMPAEGSAWWVFIPPLASKAEADKKIGELKKLGVSDFFVVQDAGPNRWAISLGVFSAESGAKSRLNELREKGVRSAKLGPRSDMEAVHQLEARGPSNRQQAMLAGVSEVIAGAQGRVCP